jgi:hypothetical protein
MGQMNGRLANRPYVPGISLYQTAIKMMKKNTVFLA